MGAGLGSAADDNEDLIYETLQSNRKQYISKMFFPSLPKKSIFHRKNMKKQIDQKLLIFVE